METEVVAEKGKRARPEDWIRHWHIWRASPSKGRSPRIQMYRLYEWRAYRARQTAVSANARAEGMDHYGLNRIVECAAYQSAGRCAWGSTAKWARDGRRRERTSTRDRTNRLEGRRRPDRIPVHWHIWNSMLNANGRVLTFQRFAQAYNHVQTAWSHSRTSGGSFTEQGNWVMKCEGEYCRVWPVAT